MSLKTKKILFISSAALLIILIAGIFFIYPRIKYLTYLLDQPSKLLSINSLVENVDEEFIEEYNPQTQRGFDVLHYNIKIELLPERSEIKGDVAIKIKVNNRAQKTIELNFYDNMKITSLTLNDAKANYKRTETNLNVSTTSALPETVFVKIKYEGKPKSLGFGSFNFDKVKNGYMIYTLNEPVFASTWFPCIDLPDDKAFTDIFITSDSVYTSLSNGKLVETKIEGDKKTFHWKTFYPISTYLIAVYSAQYKSRNEKYFSMSKDSVDIVYYSLPENFDAAMKDFSDHKKYLSTFEKLFGVYPFAKEKYSIAEFGWRLGAMENQTITGIGSRYISGMKLFRDMIIHELAHSWWGNAVSPKTWKDIWLNEGFATYSEALYWEKESGFEALQTTLIPKFAKFSNGTLYNPGDQLFTRLVYDKGAWILHMLRKEVGDSAFFKIIRNYFETYKYKNAATEDFKNICEKISGKKLKYFFDQWVYKGEGIIDAEYDWSVKKENDNFTVEIFLQQLQKGYDIYKFPLDIKIIFQDGTGEAKTFYVDQKEERISFAVKQKPSEILFDPDKWLLAEFTKKNDSE